MILKNENDIYIYFETLEQLEPKAVLDIGMFLKRVGSVSRKTMDRGVPEDVGLDGVDFYPEADFPVWKTIYNSIIGKSLFLKKKDLLRYDLAIFLGAEEILKNEEDALQMLEKIGQSANYLLTDLKKEQWSLYWPKARGIDLNVEKDAYFLLDLR